MKARDRRLGWLYLVGVIVVGGISPLPQAAFAQEQPPRFGQPQDLRSAQQALTTAREHLRSAQAKLEQLTQQKKAALPADSDWAKAQSAVEQARRQRDAAKEQTLDQLRSSAEYKDQVAELEKANAKVQQLRDSQATGGEEFRTTANRAMDTRLKLKTMESTALSNSPELKQAEEALTKATGDQTTSWDAYVQNTLSQDQAWQNAVKARDDAAEAVKTAEGQVATFNRQQPNANPTQGPTRTQPTRMQRRR